MSTIKKLLKEALKKHINEIDWEKEFKDTLKTCVPPKELVDYLNRVIANRGKKTKDREKFSATLPYVHAKSKLIRGDEVDVDDFAKQLIQRPKTLISQNTKMQKSALPNEFYYNTGIPAFRGIAYDIKNDKFYYINTCPGAGSCVKICYARKGNYIRYPDVYDAFTRKLNFLLNFPEQYEEQLYKEIKKKCEEHNALEDYENTVVIRWNDSGDFFTKKYVTITENVISRLKREGYKVFDDAYTKVADVAKTSKIGSVSFSTGGSKKELEKIDTKKQKLSMVIPKDLFKDLDTNKISNKEELKKRVAEFFNLPIKNIITYNELLKMPESKNKKWHVIVTPENGDNAAKRLDVKTILLTQHG
jgi:hypothetical protein